MKTSLWAGLALSAALLSGCAATGPGNLRVHEVLLYGGTQERVVWVYGSQTGGRGALKLGPATVDVGAQVSDPLAVPGTLSVGGKATYRVPTTALGQKLSVTRTSTGATVNVVGGGVRAVYLTDGRTWSRLNGTQGAVSLSPSAGLAGAGQLTDAEASALGAALQGQGQLAVAVLEDAAIPDAPLTVEPRPTEYLRTGLYILPGVPTAVTPPPRLPPVAVGPGTVVPRPVPAPTSPNAASPAAPATGARVPFTPLASGSQARPSAAGVRLARTDAEAAALYADAYGRQTAAPAAPTVAGGTVIGVFLGQRPTGGYSVQVVDARASGTVLTLVVRVNAPGPGTITAQVITSPWTTVRVTGRYTAVNVVDEAGQPVQFSGGGEVR